MDDEQYDIVLVRAVIHHINDLNACLKEVFRVLNPQGIVLLQDRTPEDCLIEGNETNIRGYFFTRFPNLINKEISRRYATDKVLQVLQNVGFNGLEVYKLWETRRFYKGIDELESDLLNRTGRSILYELSDKELEELVRYISEKFGRSNNESIIEKDRWTIWKAVKQ